MTLAASLRTPRAGAWADAVPDPDAALLRRYAADRDAAAFAVLVRRHGPLVFGACLRTAGHRADAEDAFQAVFLVLAQKAGRVARPELLGNWLYGVAVRVGRKARRAARRRHLREAAMADVPRPTPSAGWSDAAPVIDEELGRLAEHYRTAVLLCDVQGLSRAEAAVRLGIPEGTLSSRLNAGRKKLAERLTKRGVTLAAAVVGPLLAANATAAVPDELAGRLAAFLQHLSAGDPIGGPVGELIREGFTVRTKLWAGLLAAGIGAGLTFAAWPGGDDKPKADPPATKKPDEPKAVGKPAKPAKAKLIDTIEIDTQISSPFWSDDGKVLFVDRVSSQMSGRAAFGITTRSVTVRGYTATADGKRPDRLAAEFELPLGGFLGLYGGGSAIAAYAPAGRRINAPDMLVFTPFGDNGAGQRVAMSGDGTRVEIDVAEVGRPFAVSPDGKTVFAEKTIPVAGTNGATIMIRVLDPKTGDAVRDLGGYGDERQLVRAYRLSRAADRLFVYLHGRDYVTVECIDVATGKTVWNVQFPDRPRPTTSDGRQAPLSLSPSLLVPSRDGKVVAVHLTKGADGAEARVLNAANGESVVELQGVPDGGAAVPLDFSHDGRLLVGKTSQPRNRTPGFGAAGEGGGVPAGPLGGPGGQTGPDQLVVWDLKTGKVLRTWDDQLRVEVAFAPDRPVLAVVETERTMTGPRGGGGGFNADRGGRGGFGGGGPAVDPNAAPTVTYRSTIGFWDLAPLVK
jgi:RNA polymerase sigma factor (sigma-70 family)